MNGTNMNKFTTQIVFLSGLFFLQSCNQSYKPENPATALPPTGWENSVILTSARCDLSSDFFNFTISSQFPLLIGFASTNKIDLDLECYNLNDCVISDPFNPVCSYTTWPQAPQGLVSCIILNNQLNNCSSNGCSVNSGATNFSCFYPSIETACAGGEIGKRVCRIRNMPIGVNNFPQSISYGFNFVGPTF